MTVDEGVGEGASKVLTAVFRAVGDSGPSPSRDIRPVDDGRDDPSDVCRESFGRFGFGGDEGVIAESIVLATFFRSSRV